MDFGRTPEEEARLKALRRQRFNNTETEQQYKKMVAERAQRRKQLEEEARAARGGSRSTHLPGAQKLVGTCTLMCPAFEREEREMKNALAPQEFVPGTRKADPARTVKTFHRSAAGNEEPLPEDLRTPETLLRTLDYLVDMVIGGDQSLVSCHGFVRDRTRSIRQDFTIQNIRDHHTVAACERIARFHILSLHVLCGHKDFAEHQDMEQLRNTLKTLLELYDDHRKAGAACPNEAEFYAYYVVSHLHDSDAKRVAERLPKHIFLAPVVQQALRLHMLSESNNVKTTKKDMSSQYAVQNLTTQFFRAVASTQTPLLLACLAEYFFPSIRHAAIKAMNNAFPYQEGKEYPVDELAAMFAFDSVEEVREFCALFNLSVTQRGVKLGERANKQSVFSDVVNQPRRVSRNLRVVGAKFHMSPMQVINSTLQLQLLAPGTPSAILRPPAAATGPGILPLGGEFARNMAVGKIRSTPAAAATAAAATATIAAQHSRPAPQLGLNRAAKEFVPNQAFQRPPLPRQSSASAFASTFTGILDQKPRVVSPIGAASQTTKAKKMVSFSPGSAGSTTITAGSSQPLFSSAPPATAASNVVPSRQQGLFSNHGDKPGTGPIPGAAPFSGQSQPTPASGATQIQALALPKTESKPAIPAPAVPPVPATPPPDIVWNKPRHRINWTSLSNAVYYNLVESLVLETVEPIYSRTRANIKAADVLAMDITTAIVDYTSAFIAYEESYRCVLFAQADTFRRKSLLRNAFSRWSMESAMIQQDKILQQQYLDDLHDLIDTEYMVGHQHRVRSETGGNLDAFANTIDSQLGLLPARGRGLSTGFGQSPKYAEVRENDTMPAGFWDSDQMGREGFESLCKALRRYGVPAFQLSVALFHTQPESVLHSWLWWQIDPSSISQTSEDNESSRWVVYSNNGQTMTFREYGADSDDQPLSAQIVLLSPEPLEARHLGGAVLGYSRLEDMISNCVESALELARTRANNNDNGRHASMPLLFIFWYTDSRVKRSVRRMVESIAGASGIPSFVSINVLALDIANSKKQLAAGMRWMYKHLYQSLRSSFVRVPRAYAVVCDTMVQSLRRMRNCIIGLLKCWPSDTPEAFSVFNDVVSVANAFIEIFNTNVFVSPKCPRVCKYPHLTDSQTLSTAYFGQRMHSSSGGSSSSGGGVDGLAMLATNLVVGAAVDEILCSDTVYGSDGTMLPTLGAYMRAFEVVVKNQLDMLQQSLPADIYADKQAVAAATKQAVQMSGQLVEHAARLCQQSNAGGGVYQDPFMTPRPKRSLSLAFSNGSPPLSLFSAAFDAEDTPESTAQSVVSMSTQSTTVKRQRASPSFNLSRLQGAIARASRHLK